MQRDTGIVLTELRREFVGRCTFPGTNWLLNRKHIWRNYQALMEGDACSAEKLASSQLQGLQQILTRAQQWSPFYADRLRSAGIRPEDIEKLEDIELIPPLSRHDLIRHRASIIDSRYRESVMVADQASRPPGEPVSFAAVRRHRLVRNTSTGSTGEPVVFYEDGSTTAMSWAHELRLKRWFGLAPGEREARFARVSTDFIAKSKSLRMRQLLWNQLILPGINLADQDYALCLERIDEFRPRLFFGITTALMGFAKYIRANSIPTESIAPEVIITWASPLYDHEKTFLQETFHCPVSNIYGSREVGHVASMCPEGNLHIHQENYYVEIERDSAEKANNGPGQLLITPLFTTPMPLVRYRIGDVGEFDVDRCPCGRQHLVLRNLLGRTAEIFTTREGRTIPPNFWCRVFMGESGSDNVEQFQVVLERDGGLRFRVVRRQSYSPNTETQLRQYIADQLQSAPPLAFEYVNQIATASSGKFQMVIDEREPEALGRT